MTPATTFALRPRVNGVPRLVHKMDVGEFWTAVDAQLAPLGQVNASWLEELAAPYAAGMSVHDTFLQVLQGRRAKP